MDTSLSRKERIKAINDLPELHPFIRIYTMWDKANGRFTQYDVLNKENEIIYSLSLEEAAIKLRDSFIKDLLDDARRRKDHEDYKDTVEWIDKNVENISYSTDGFVAAFKTGDDYENEDCYATFIISSFSKFYHNHDEVEFETEFDIDWDNHDEVEFEMEFDID